MNGLIREARRWALLLLLGAVALGALRQPGPSDPGIVGVVLGAGVLGAMLWNLRRLHRLLRPRGGQEAIPPRPELPGRSQWVGPRTRDPERRG